MLVSLKWQDVQDDKQMEVMNRENAGFFTFGGDVTVYLFLQ